MLLTFYPGVSILESEKAQPASGIKEIIEFKARQRYQTGSSSFEHIATMQGTNSSLNQKIENIIKSAMGKSYIG
jgi:hypothetical protein